ncbi:ribonuclease kappa-B [Frankliniella occidentalis]|uniref:Ribonuclease kappa-B n=1 Tax=Frankliniella occidentalis TaxID=133901 RepID=A0A6J1SK21_FRAOC|nr:ribonuclease kappa-B [Frankliniella occidentalis]
MLKICGPKLSLCGLIISAWGIVQLVLMGIFYYVQSVGLAEDLSVMEENFETQEEFYAAADSAYQQNAYNCWIAACLYIFTLLISGQQFYQNSRNSLDA